MRGYAAIGLFHPKKDPNIGGALRAAHIFGASVVVIQGKHYKKQGSDTTAAYRHIPLFHSDDLMEAIPYDCVPVAIEILPGATSLEKYIHPQRAFYVFGPENGSLGSSVVNKCRDKVSIPSAMCLNLAATVNVVLYDRLAKHLVNESMLDAARKARGAE